MRQRVRELGGDLKILSSKAGTSLRICIPIAEKMESESIAGDLPSRRASAR